MATNNAASHSAAPKNYGKATENVGQVAAYKDEKPQSRQNTGTKSGNRLSTAG